MTRTEATTVRQAPTELIRFRKVRSGSSGATWSQLDTWRWLSTIPGRTNQTNLRFVVELPRSCSPSGALSALARLLQRHDSLCTRLTCRIGEEIGQEVLGEGVAEVAVWIVDPMAHLPDVLADLSARLAESIEFDPFVDLPVLFHLVRYREQQHVVVVASRFAVEATGRKIFTRDLLMLAGEEEGPPPTDDAAKLWQPTDEANFERSTEGQRLHARSVERWRTLLAGAPPPGRPLLAHPPESPRYSSGTLISRAVYLAIGDLAERWQVTATAVTLAAMSTALATYFATTSWTTRIVINNRFGPRYQDIVYTVAQDGLLQIPVVGHPLEDVARFAQKAILLATRSSRYHPYALIEALEPIIAAPGALLGQSSYFNMTLAPPVEPGMNRTLSSAEWSRLRDESKFNLLDSQDGLEVTIMLNLSQWNQCSYLKLTVDTATIPAADVQELLVALEGCLVDLAADGGAP